MPDDKLIVNLVCAHKSRMHESLNTDDRPSASIDNGKVLTINNEYSHGGMMNNDRCADDKQFVWQNCIFSGCGTIYFNIVVSIQEKS